MFGGQNLQPVYGQTQYDDMWILSVPSFTWIPVNMSSQSVPYPRAGHTCNIWDGQIIMIGGHVSQDISCESPGVYVFNTSSLQWTTSFTSLAGSLNDNPFSQQVAQRGKNNNLGLHGSYSYTVPKLVYDIIGGNTTGGATVTAPVQLPTSGPLATGKPLTYIVTDTTLASSSASSTGGTNVGAAVAGAVAGFFFLAALYLLFCLLLYRKQLAIHKRPAGVFESHSKSQHDTEGETSRLVSMWKHASFMPGRNSSGKESTDRTSFSNSTSQYEGHPVAWVNSQTMYQHGLPAVSNEDLMGTLEPSYWGVLLHPRRSLRVINR